MKKIIKLRFTLKQIVSMLHFQGDEEDATIRATNLKPKLDKYLYHYYAWENKLDWTPEGSFSDEVNKIKKVLINMKKKWSKMAFENSVIDYKELSKHALNYKVKIIPISPITRNNADLVASCGKTKEYVGAAKYVLTEKKNEQGEFTRNEPTDVHKKGKKHNKIFVDIICYEEKLAELLIKSMPSFIASTGFGFASGKGYGSFMLEKIESVLGLSLNDACLQKMQNLDNTAKLMSEYKAIMNYKNEDAVLVYELKDTIVRKIEQEGDLDWLKRIDEYNHFIKSGLNAYKFEGGKMKPEYYAESPLLKGYFKESRFENFSNEKMAMKTKLTQAGYTLKQDSKNEDIDVNKKINDVLYTRGLFGFAQEYSFLVLKFKDKYTLRKFKVSAKTKNRMTISRFANPISYRIMIEGDCYKVYMIVNQACVRALQKLSPQFSFNFKTNFRDEKRIFINGILPDSNMFNFKDYIKKYLMGEMGKKFKYKTTEGYVQSVVISELKEG